MLIRSSRIAPTNATSAPVIDLRRIRRAAAIAAAFALCLILGLRRTRRRLRLLDELGHGHDRPCQPRRHQRQPELDHRRRRPAWRRGRRRPHLLDEHRHGRSAAPTSTAPAPTRLITDAGLRRRRGRRRPHLLARDGTDTIGRANLGGTDVDPSFITGPVPAGRRSRRRPHLLDGRLPGSRTRSAAPTSTAPAWTSASSAASGQAARR